MERLDRNYGELLQELRVAQTGVQLLVAFLLSIAFSPRFAETTPFQRGVYFGTLLLAVTATILLIAPVSHHRIVFRHRLKRELVKTANSEALAGLMLLALALLGAVLLITDFLFDGRGVPVDRRRRCDLVRGVLDRVCRCVIAPGRRPEPRQDR